MSDNAWDLIKGCSKPFSHGEYRTGRFEAQKIIWSYKKKSIS